MHLRHEKYLVQQPRCQRALTRWWMQSGTLNSPLFTTVGDPHHYFILLCFQENIYTSTPMEVSKTELTRAAI